MSQQGQHVVQKLFEICDPIKLSKHLGKIYFKKYNFVLEHFYDCRSKDLFLLGRRGIMISPTSYKQLLHQKIYDDLAGAQPTVVDCMLGVNSS